ncbi:CorA family divalent cation transporter [uncultured Chitinophaga sp.]|uniref:magnesium transporter CorA family protein n=1 Tax=uncultured Chitinophaga sp. TaxID=339340 RepID=UPI0025D3C1C1|nr:CorA family divalent cation transporter [uncultured Chitinophaga sp.]
MRQELAVKEKNGYTWIDLSNPEEPEFATIAQTYQLPKAWMTDALEADHLPKFEKQKDYGFVIIRQFDGNRPVNGADTVKELTNKAAIFFGEDYIVTMHREPWPALENISQAVSNGDCDSPFHALIEVVRAALQSFDEPAIKLNHSIDLYEEQVFLKNRKAPMLKGLYYIKRKVDVIRHILLLTRDIIERLDPPERNDIHTRDLRDLYIKQQSIYDMLAENTTHLLGIYFNISAQKTNETIRVLTIFSVFFLPLTFIVGVYGMNFDFMPELRWRAGYPAVMLLMVLVTGLIYAWFKRKKWL